MSRASRAALVALCLIAGLVATASPALAATITVDPSAADFIDSPVGGGSCSLREAVEVANTNDNSTIPDCAAGTPGLDTITIDPGEVELDNAGLGTIVITEDLVIQGGGLAEIYMDNLGWEGFLIDPSAAVTFEGLTLRDNDSSSAISNEGDLTLEAVSIVANDSENEAGAVLHESGTLTVRNSSFEDNTSEEGGGALYLDGGTVTIEDSSFTSNSTLEDGGAINMAGTDLTIRRTEFVSNTADSSSGALFADCSCSGGASLLVEDSTFRLNGSPNGGAMTIIGEASITGTLFSQNTADLGGAIQAFGGDPGDVLSLEESQFEGNEAQVDGGAIFTLSAEVEVTDSTLTLNEASDVGGAISSFDSLVVIERSTLSNNEAQGAGGAVFAGLSQVAIVNSTISGNSVSDASGQGGGIYFTDVLSRFVHSTITDNSAPGEGGGAWTEDPIDALSDGTIIAGNPVGGDCNIPLGELSPNLDSDGTCFPAAGSVTADPLLGPLANNGGPTETHALPPGSPALNIADDGPCGELSGVDQRGEPRPSGGACDLGAYELQVAAAPPTPKHTLTVTNAGGGTVTSEELEIDCGTECEATLDEGTTGVLIATPDDGSVFDGWEGDCASIDENECTAEMNGDREVTARFVIPRGACKGMLFGSSEVRGGTELIAGTPGDDVLTGNGRRNVICGLGGNDTIKGKNLGDDLLGGGGDDTLVGGKGADLLNGGPGTDECRGGKGKDKLIACE